VPALQGAAPAPVVEINYEDAARLKISAGETVRVGSRRGVIELEAKLSDIIPGHLFIPFHYGNAEPSRERTAANELTITDWDPVSKQPQFKFAAVWIQKA